MTLPARAALTSPAQPSIESGRKCSGSRILVVDAAVDDVHGLLARGRAHEHAVVAADEVATLDQLDTHLAGEERVLEVRRVVHAGREHDDVRVRDAGGRGRAQRLEQLGRIVGNRAHAVRREQLGEHVRHRPPVLDDVRDARRRAHVVLEHAEPAFAVADEVDAGNVHAHPARRLDARDRAVEVLRRDDEAAGHDPVAQDLAGAVDVGEEPLEREHPLRDAPLDRSPTRRRR